MPLKKKRIVRLMILGGQRGRFVRKTVTHKQTKTNHVGEHGKRRKGDTG